jgi:hypothetical protein
MERAQAIIVKIPSLGIVAEYYVGAGEGCLEDSGKLLCCLAFVCNSGCERELPSPQTLHQMAGLQIAPHFVLYSFDGQEWHCTVWGVVLLFFPFK